MFEYRFRSLFLSFEGGYSINLERLLKGIIAVHDSIRVPLEMIYQEFKLLCLDEKEKEIPVPCDIKSDNKCIQIYNNFKGVEDMRQDIVFDNVIL